MPKRAFGVVVLRVAADDSVAGPPTNAVHGSRKKICIMAPTDLHEGARKLATARDVARAVGTGLPASQIPLPGPSAVVP